MRIIQLSDNDACFIVHSNGTSECILSKEDLEGNDEEPTSDVGMAVLRAQVSYLDPRLTALATQKVKELDQQLQERNKKVDTNSKLN